MKTLYLIIYFLLAISCIPVSLYSQQLKNDKINDFKPAFFSNNSHNPNFLKSAPYPEKSFYQQKSEWKHIIDTTWGPGASLEDKLKIYNAYAQVVHDKYCNFDSLTLNYDTLYNRYLNMINDSTSKGAFSSIMARFSSELRSGHATAFDNSLITLGSLTPGTPIIATGTYMRIQRFGAVTTVLPDSTTLVLRVVPNHPLNIEPGDIILGYEGVPWKNLVPELINAGVPWIPSLIGGSETAYTYQLLSGAGLNWHLFSTIDILKYSSGDTIHLSVEPMKDFKMSEQVNNEQLPVKNIPMPTNLEVKYGVVENSNIGYIYLPSEEGIADKQFSDAVDSLKNTEALIIDMRLNFGGESLLESAFNKLFNEFHKTLGSAMRCDKNTFELCPIGDSQYNISGRYPDYYDRPIAVLVGPSCFSMGEIIAHRLSYHPMVKFFGASTLGTMPGNAHIENIPNWYLEYPVSDKYHHSDPGNYLNMKEFPVDFPVWFNKDDVAKGIDPVVERAKEWINTLAYGHSIALNKSFLSTEDTLKATAIVENPEAHELMVKLIIESLDSAVMDSVEMKPLNTNDEKVWHGIFVSENLPENFYWLSVKVEDKTTGTFFTNRHMTRMTTVPLIIDSLAVRKIADYSYSIQPYFKNEADAFTIEQYTSVTLSANPWVKAINPKIGYMKSLKPGQTEKVNPFRLTCDTATFQNHFDLKFMVANKEWPFWVLDTTVTVINTSAEDLVLVPLTNNLDQNYPNPFNAETTISWQLAKGNRVSLTVFNILGSKVMTLLDEVRPAGNYETQLNASTLPKGIYFYQLKAGKFIQTRKMIVVK